MSDKNTYIINTRDVCNIGGGQLYVLRRAKHLVERNYNVIIIVAIYDGNFMLKNEFGSIPVYYVPEFNASSIYISPKRRDNTIEKVMALIGVSENYFIESHTLEGVEWGEILASRLNAKHLGYLLAEPNVNEYRWKVGIDIFKNKLLKNEFWGCSSVSLRTIWGKDILPNNYINIAFDEAELSEKSSPSINYVKQKFSYCITTVSRLEKTYIEKLIKDSQKLALTYPNQKFDLVIIGGSSDKSRENYLFDKYGEPNNSINNLNIYFTGFVKNIGRDIFSFTDVFVGMGTASINAISQKCLCINIDPSNNDMASGFFGVDTTNFAYTCNGQVYSIFDKLNQAYNFEPTTKENYIQEGRRLFEKEYSLDATQSRIDQVINGCTKVNTDSIYLPGWLKFNFVFACRKMAKVYRTIKGCLC